MPKNKMYQYEKLKALAPDSISSPRHEGDYLEDNPKSALEYQEAMRYLEDFHKRDPKTLEKFIKESDTTTRIDDVYNAVVGGKDSREELIELGRKEWGRTPWWMNRDDDWTTLDDETLKWKVRNYATLDSKRLADELKAEYDWPEERAREEQRANDLLNEKRPPESIEDIRDLAELLEAQAKVGQEKKTQAPAIYKERHKKGKRIWPYDDGTPLLPEGQ